MKLRCKNSASRNWMLNTQYLLHQALYAKILHLKTGHKILKSTASLAKMQKFCFWETGYKIPKIDCIKLRCKNSASGKMNTKYLKLTASSYSLSQNCRDTVVSSRPPNVGVHDLVTESQ